MKLEVLCWNWLGMRARWKRFSGLTEVVPSHFEEFSIAHLMIPIGISFVPKIVAEPLTDGHTEEGKGIIKGLF